MENPSQSLERSDELPSFLAPAVEQSVSPNNPPWNSLAAFALWAISIVLMIFVPLLFVAPYMIVQYGGQDRAQVSEAITKDPIAILLSIVAVFPVHALTLLAAWPIVTNLRRYSFIKMLGNKWGGMRWWHFIVILVGFFTLASVVTYFFPEQDDELTRILQSSQWVVYAIAFLATFTAPIVEEIVYRGVLYPSLRRDIGVYWAILIVAAMFAGVHFIQYWGSPGTLILISVLSLILTLIRERTGNILPCVVFHFIFNGLQSLGIVLGSSSPHSGSDPQAVTSFIFRLF